MLPLEVLGRTRTHQHLAVDQMPARTAIGSEQLVIMVAVWLDNGGGVAREADGVAASPSERSRRSSSSVAGAHDSRSTAKSRAWCPGRVREGICCPEPYARPAVDGLSLVVLMRQSHSGLQTVQVALWCSTEGST